MEKTLQIDGKQVHFKCTAGTMLRYRNQFNREFMSDISKLSTVSKTNPEGLTLSPFYDIVWVLAKTADSSIPDQIAWYDSFDSFPIIDVFLQLEGLVMACLKTKNSSAAAALPLQKKRRKRR